MAQSQGTLPRDGNNVPIQGLGMVVTKSLTFSANGAQTLPIFKITGSVRIDALYGVVLTALGSNHTAASWRLNDQTAQIYLTAVGGTTLSSAPAGSVVIKNVLVATAVTLKSSAAGAILEPATVNENIFSPIILTQKAGGIETDIEYCYTTNNSSAGKIQFFCGFTPLSADGDVSAV